MARRAERETKKEPEPFRIPALSLRPKGSGVSIAAEVDLCGDAEIAIGLTRDDIAV
jgi:hypothetical protein